MYVIKCLLPLVQILPWNMLRRSCWDLYHGDKKKSECCQKHTLVLLVYFFWSFHLYYKVNMKSIFKFPQRSDYKKHRCSADFIFQGDLEADKTVQRLCSAINIYFIFDRLKQKTYILLQFKFEVLSDLCSVLTLINTLVIFHMQITQTFYHLLKQ